MAVVLHTGVVEEGVVGLLEVVAEAILATALQGKTLVQLLLSVVEDGDEDEWAGVGTDDSSSLLLTHINLMLHQHQSQNPHQQQK